MTVLGVAVAAIGGVSVALVSRTCFRADSRVGAYARRNLFFLIAGLLLITVGMALAFGVAVSADR